MVEGVRRKVWRLADERETQGEQRQEGELHAFAISKASLWLRVWGRSESGCQKQRRTGERTEAREERREFSRTLKGVRCSSSTRNELEFEFEFPILIDCTRSGKMWRRRQWHGRVEAAVAAAVAVAVAAVTAAAATGSWHAKHRRRGATRAADKIAWALGARNGKRRASESHLRRSLDGGDLDDDEDDDEDGDETGDVGRKGA